MLLGAHEATAGGLHLAFDRAARDGCEAIQIFTSFNLRWARRILEHEHASLFCSARAAFAGPVWAHAIYLLNLASADRQLWQRSLEALFDDLLLGETLGLDYLVLHPGVATSGSREAGLRRIAAALSELHARAPGFHLRLVLENTAGQGATLGVSFAELAWLLEQTDQGERLGVCLDTCHAWAAGYDLASAEGYEETVAELERLIGLEQLCVFHLNDAKRPRGSRVDRHASIGEGELGLLAFARLMRDPRFADKAGIVETPAEPDGTPSFRRNIATLKALREG